MEPMPHHELTELQARRWNDPQTRRGALERLERASAQARANEGRVHSQVRRLEKAPRIQQKIFWLRQLAQTFSESVAPHAACKDGCDGCCRQPVALTQQEAELIARETGAALHVPADWSSEGKAEYVAQPCSFLKDSRCTIYEHRPMVCRLMFNMDVDALLCQRVPGALSHVPYADYSQHKELYIRAHLGKVKTGEEMRSSLGQLRLADVREFFPHGLHKPLG